MLTPRVQMVIDVGDTEMSISVAARGEQLVSHSRYSLTADRHSPGLTTTDRRHKNTIYLPSIPARESLLLCKDKRQYLPTRKVSRYCLLALHGSIAQTHCPGGLRPAANFILRHSKCACKYWHFINNAQMNRVCLIFYVVLFPSTV